MRRLALLTAGFLLASCASSSMPGAMVPEVQQHTIIKENSPLYGAISITSISGGKSSSLIGTAQVSNDVLAEALMQALASHAMLARGQGNYRLDVNLVKLSQPFIALDIKASSTIQYKVTEISTDRTVFLEIIQNEYTAAYGDALLGDDREHLANEGSVKGNIAKFLLRLVQEMGSPVS